MKNISYLALFNCTLALMGILFSANLFSMGCPKFNNKIKGINCPERYYTCCDDSDIVTKIMDKLFELPEIKRKNVIVDSLTNHKSGISMRVLQKPGKSIKYYWIAVGYNSNIRFETYYNFYVWPDKMVIRYLDAYSGKLLTLKEWRKLKSLNAK